MKIFTTCVRFELAALFVLALVGGCNRNCQNLFRGSSSDFTISERVNQGQLDNGVSFYYLKNSQPSGRCYLRLSVAVGSFAERENERGMAHMVEHLAFDDREVSKDESLAEWFQKHGMAMGPDANAYTTSDSTVYKIDLPSCTQEAVAEALQIFRSFAQGLLFAQSAIDKEKNIVDAEERDYKNARGDLTEKFIQRLFAGTPHVTRPVLGDQKTRAQFTQEMFKNFYQTWYQPKNLSVIVVGDYGDLPINAMISDVFAKLAPMAPPGHVQHAFKVDYRYPAFALHDKELSTVDTVFAVQPKILDLPVINRSLLKERLAFDLAISMLANQYEANARAKASTLRPPSISGYMYDRGAYELALSVVEKPELYEKTFTDAYLLLRSRAELGFDEADFNAIREVYEDSFRRWVIEEPTWNSGAWADRLINHVNKKSFLYGGADFQKFASPLLADITAKDCQRALKNALKSGNHFIFALGAIEENDQSAQKLKTLLATANKVPFEKPASMPAVTFQYSVEACETVPVVSQKSLPAIKSELFTFPNNITLAVKKTDFKKDEIMVELFTDEGFATMNERDLAVAKIAQWAIMQGGLSKHPPEQLPALFLNKVVSSSLAILDNRIQTSITTRNQDLSFALTFARALIVDPLYSEVALTQIKEALAVKYQSSKHNMHEPLGHDFLKELTGNDKRVGRIPLELLQSITRDELFAWHKKYIAGKRFNVVVVGDVDPEHIKREVGCILGSLPKNEPTPAKNPPPLTYKSGLKKTYKVDTTDATSKVNVIYPLGFTTGKYPDSRLRLMQDLLQESLRLKLREKRQVTYAANVIIRENKEAYAQNVLDVYVPVTKTDAVRVRDDIIKILNKFAQRGVREHELLKAKEPFIADAQRMLSQNAYWSSLFANNFPTLAALTWVNTLEADIKAVKAQDINLLMKKYLRSPLASSAIVHADK